MFSQSRSFFLLKVYAVFYTLTSGVDAVTLTLADLTQLRQETWETDNQLSVVG